MDRQNIELFICKSSGTIVDTMKKIDANSYGLCYVVDDANRLVGCVTDGDIRRWIIRGGVLLAAVREAMNTTPIYVKEDERYNAMRLMLQKQITSIAVVNEEHRIIDVLFSVSRGKNQRKGNELKNIPVIIMAGGKGTRLLPFTKILPKPLIPVGDVPILERIMNRFAEYGVNKYWLTVNYRKEMIKSYFKESRNDYNIIYIEEEKPLGTAGSLRFINTDFDKPLIITNCDILIDTDYSKCLDFHIKSGNDLTIVSSLKTTVIPYGVLTTKEDGLVISMEEKPELSHFVNTGMYIINPKFLDWIPEGKEYHMTDLAEQMIMKGKRVGIYPISENSFLDMGEFAEMKRMEERINAGLVQ